ARERSAAKTSSMPRSVDSVASTTGPVRGREGLNTQRVMRLSTHTTRITTTRAETSAVTVPCSTIDRRIATSGFGPSPRDAKSARGEVGKVGVPIAHIGDMRALFDGIPLQHMNTSMTINAPAMWLLALYLTAAEEQGADIAQLAGTTQNDIIKEYLSRGTYV